MRLFLAVRHRGYLRPFESTIASLLQRGHQVVLAERYEKRGNEAADAIVDRLLRTGELTLDEHVPPPTRDDLAADLRDWMNHLRYLEAPFDSPGSALHTRAARSLSDALVAADVDATAADPTHPSRLRRVLAAIEPRVADVGRADEALARADPDAVVVTPLIERRESQVGYVRAAARRAIPRGVLIASWDNLTTSGLLHDVPDVVAVWNEAQRREAIELMGVPESHIVVTGAPGFDQWFGRTPSRSREQLCADMGLPDARPYVLYLGSSPFIALEEPAFLTRWLKQLRGSEHPSLRHASIVVRPHPFNALEGALARVIARDPRVVLHPGDGRQVVDEEAIDDYFDALWHAAAVVGINTSGLIEAAIVGRPTLVPLTKRFRESQLGSPHFHHLLPANGGPVIAGTLDDHERALAEVLVHGWSEADRARSTAFVERFVRPSGLDVPSTPTLVAVIEELAARRVFPAPSPPPLGRPEMDELRAVLDGNLAWRDAEVLAAAR
jgi:hypothetical protein